MPWGKKSMLKDKRIRIYREKYTEDGTVKRYIHPKGTTLKAHVRQVSANEMSTMSAIQDASDHEFIVNFRKIETDMLIEFKGKTYKINAVDRYKHYRNTDLKLIGSEYNPPEYIDEVWEDD